MNKITMPEYLQDNIEKLSDISFCTYIQRKPQHKNEVEIKSNVLIFVRRGTKILHVKDKTIEIKDDAILFLRSGNYIMSEVLDEYYDAMIFIYEDNLLLDFINKYSISFDSSDSVKTSIFKIENNEELKSLINSSFNYYQSDIQNKEQLIKLKLEEAFLNILNSSSKNCFNNLLKSIHDTNYFKSQVIKEFSYDENILDLANKFKMPSLAFREIFKKEFKTTPKKWQTQKRLERAKILLETSDKNVSEVCHEVGFDNISWFIQVFKKQYNLTPKQIKTNKN